MALRAGYKGFKKLAEGLKMIRPGILAVDNTILADTFFTRQDQGVLGARNLFNVSVYDFMNQWAKVRGATQEIVDDEVYLTLDDQGSSGAYIIRERLNTLFPILLTNECYISFKIKASKNVKIQTGPDTARERFDVTTEYTDFKYILNPNLSTIVFCIYNVPGAENPEEVVLYIKDFMISLVGDSLEYVKPAMTNQDLTARSEETKTTVNGILTAASGASDFAEFKTALAALTPVTRSLNRTASPEDVPEEVIEEKPVTKKTTKKTVKEGE